MGRLIDADALIIRLRKESVIPFSKMLLNDEHRWFLKLEDMINTQPTAYDVEKVEKQIEEMFGVDPMYYGTEARWAVDKAIEIVRKGGAK